MFIIFEKHILSSEGDDMHFRLYMMTFGAQGLAIIIKGFHDMYQK